MEQNLKIGQEISLDEIKSIMDNHDRENPNAVNIYYDFSKIYLGREHGKSDIMIGIERTGKFPMFRITDIKEV